MKKITDRAISVLLIASLVLFGLGYFIYLDYQNGKGWATYFSIYNSDSDGIILDRNGIELARFNGSQSTFSNDSYTRIANYHVTGDYWGRTGTGLLSRYWDIAQKYDALHGTTVSESTRLDLNIDVNINNMAFQQLQSRGKGCVMICNYRTGEVLCMVSSPSVDPLDNSSEVQDGAYINRCLSAVYTPGSTFKLITAAAAIEKYSALNDFHFTCEKTYDIAGVKITCTEAHGDVDFSSALANSCNCAFAKITVALGQDNMVDYVRGYGFLSPQYIDGIKTSAGNYPTEFVGDPELGWSGVGQSTDQMCPYTMLRFVSAIANGGNLAEPHLVKTEGDPQLTGVLNASTALRLQQLMRNNVVSHYEENMSFPGLQLCAKTGTAETASGNDHSWFVGFLQDEDHPYAFVALVENGGFGLYTAGEMMNKILQYAVKR